MLLPTLVLLRPDDEPPKLGTVRVPTPEDMTIQRMDHVGVVVDDLAAATAFFVALGLSELEQYEDSYRLRYVRGPEGMIVELAEQRS